jgi:predicted permease
MRWRGKRAARDFAEEIQAHLQLEADELEAEGLSRREAGRSARVAFGSPTVAQERFNLMNRPVWLENLAQDIRYGLRIMARDRAFTAVAALTLAIGIGVSTTAFTWIDAVLRQPLSGVSEPNRLVTLESVTPNGEWVPNSYPDYMDFRDHLKLFDGIAVSHPGSFSVGNADHAELVRGELVSGNFFAVLGVAPQVGRVFLPAEYGDKPGAFPVAVLSDRYWRSHYGANPGVVGTTIRINQHELTIAGVAPPAFHGSIPVTAFDLWVPYMQQPTLNGVQHWMLRDRHDRNMLGIARLKPNVTIEQARGELDSLARRMAVANADVSEGMTATLLPLWKSPFGPQGLLVGPLRILMAVCLLVLLIVCVNVANLLLARATVRQKEFNTRLALGAGRIRLVRQLLTESLMLAAVGAALGVAATPWLSHALQYLMPPGQLALVLNTQLNLRVLLFTIGICLMAALAAGLAPALQLSHMGTGAGMNLSTRLNEGRGAAGRGRHRLRSALVASEVALALVALVGAGLFAQGFRQTLHIDPGFDPDQVLLSQFYLSTTGYNLQQRKEFCRRLAERMQGAPGVTNVAYSDGVPLGFEPSWWEELHIEGYAPALNENMNIFRNVISPGYLELMHIPLIEGRSFTEADKEDAPQVMIVNQAFVRRFFAGRNPLGARIHGWGSWFRVVGVVKDSKYHYLSESPVPYFYVPFRQIYREDMNLAFYVRSPGDPATVLALLRTQVRQIDPSVNVFDAVPLKEFIGASLYPQKMAASLMTVLGCVAVLLAAVGLYGVMAYSVAQRTQEIGMRMALGAQPGSVLRMVVRQGLALAFTGLIAGVALALGLARAVSAISFTNSAMGASAKLLGASTASPWIYLGSAAFLCAIAACAAYIPARRAAATDPMQALRME